LTVWGPLGRGFSPPRPKDRLALVAGGYGVAPLVFLAEQYGGAQVGLEAFVGASTAERLVGEQELKRAGVPLTLTTEDGSRGLRGVVTDPLRVALAEGRVDRVCACGPMGMLKAVASLCQAIGLAAEVSVEERMGCGVGSCLGCAMPRRGCGYSHYQMVCRDGPVFAASDLDWDSIEA